MPVGAEAEGARLFVGGRGSVHEGSSAVFARAVQGRQAGGEHVAGFHICEAARRMRRGSMCVTLRGYETAVYLALQSPAAESCWLHGREQECGSAAAAAVKGGRHGRNCDGGGKKYEEGWQQTIGQMADESEREAVRRSEAPVQACAQTCHVSMRGRIRCNTVNATGEKCVTLNPQLFLLQF